MRSNCCFTRVDFLRRKWLFMCLVRMIWPVPVILKRRAAPLWVFILGMVYFNPHPDLSRAQLNQQYLQPACASHRGKLYHIRSGGANRELGILGIGSGEFEIR